MRTCPNCGHEMLNDNFAECPKCGFNLYSHNKKNNSLFSNINKKLPKSIGDISEQITTQVKKEEAYIKSRLDDDSTALVDDNEFFISKTVFDGVDYITNKKQEFKTGRVSKNQNKNTTSVKVDDINQETEKPKKETQKTDKPNYNNLELSDLQETLINTLPLIDNPSEYEENIINKYAEYNSEQRKELLKDCWTVTRLAEKHNIKRHEVEKAILSDEFLNKDLIGVFKVNPNNIRSLKILYRKPLTEAGQKQKTKNLATDNEVTGEVKEIPEEPVPVSKINDNSKNKKTQQEETNKTFYNKKSPNAKSLKKEFENQLKFYLGGIFTRSEDCKKRLVRHNKMDGDTNVPAIITTLKKEFFNGKLAFEDIDGRIDELMELDILSLKKDVVDKKQDSSIIKTQDDLNNLLGPKYVEKYKKKVDRKSKGVQLFKKYNVDTRNAYCFECKFGDQKGATVSHEYQNNNFGDAYVALYDDRLVIIQGTFLFGIDVGLEKIFFNNVEFINFEEGDGEQFPSMLYIGLRTMGQTRLGYILPKDAKMVLEKYEQYKEKNNSEDNEKTNESNDLFKYAELYKQGLLTKEEFEAKKKELL